MNRHSLTYLTGHDRADTGLTRDAPVGKDTQRLEELLIVNRLAATVWQLLDGNESVDEIAAKIALEFQLSRSRAYSETCGLIRMFAQMEMVSVTR